MATGSIPTLNVSQASVYDATRKRLLCGREDMLGLLAAQLKYRESQRELSKPVWVDVSTTGMRLRSMGRR